MRIVYHLGAHCTDEDRLVRCLLKNRARLAEQGIAVPAPTRYRTLLRDTASQLRGAAASDETQAMILEQIIEEATADRLILSWTGFLGFPAYVVANGLYGHGGDRLREFTRIFSDFEAEFHLAIRNPATFLPDLRGQTLQKGHGDILAAVDPFALHWSEAVRHILATNPNVPLTVWCDEDTPLIWPEVLELVSGHAPGTPLEEDDELIANLLTEAGLKRLRAYCQEHPPQSVAQRRRIVTAFLEKFGRPEALATEIALPGWTEEVVGRLTRSYLADVERIAQMPGVRLLEA
ncbi:hypothetical protein [Tabrizicola sp.]|jgi:hypothetical protein|uniref:hypothetical protein n=1 Tax=Tabrizicola sp. TaxID=2005166 RepID=UPI0025F2B8AE|nr:hypothetical protein [Tabrizicola sp.]MBY0351105.1 hypothetical protein [Tabrizicola sp.]